jgi:NADH dehydrogenase/NADH oxidase (H2O2-forming)
MKKYDILVIGGGPAAITIAKTIQNNLKVGIIRPENHSMVYCAMPYAIEGLLPVEKTLKKDSLVTDTEAELIRDRATYVNFKQRFVNTEENGEISYEKLIIATGASPLLPPIEGIGLNGVMTFQTEKDLLKITGLIDKGLKQVVIVGAGAIGIELAQAFNTRHIETDLVDMAEHVLPNMLDYEIVKEAQESLIESGINLHLKNKVIALKGSDNVEEIILDNDRNIQFANSNIDSKTGKQNLSGLVIFAVGMKPNIELFKDSELKTAKDGIIISNRMETNLKDVFAVGDCCQFISGISGQILSGKLATNAVPMGRVLAKNLLGRDRVYSGFFNGAATKINNFYLGGTGLTEKTIKKLFDVQTGYAEFTTAFPMMPNSTKVRLKLIADKKSHKILGGQFISGKPVADKVYQITMSIHYGITLQQLVNFSYSAQPYQSFFPANNLIVKAAEDILTLLNEP